MLHVVISMVTMKRAVTNVEAHRGEKWGNKIQKKAEKEQVRKITVNGRRRPEYVSKYIKLHQI